VRCRLGDCLVGDSTVRVSRGDDFGAGRQSQWHGDRKRERVRPSSHASIDGTGWVQSAKDVDTITGTGQVFRMAMYHPNHPDKNYETANLVEVFDEVRAIAWKTGTEDAETGDLSFGGWLWRYDLEPTSPQETTVTLTYNWSAVGPDVREYVEFPMFPLEHLDNSPQHLAELVTNPQRS
jgi:hypothetical protein